MSLPQAEQALSPEQQIDWLRVQLAQAQKLTALGELVGSTTHEFNNVLMTIINYAKMGMRHKDTETRDKALDKILTAANRAAKITNGILAFARNRSQSLEPTDLVRVVNDSLMLLEREMSRYRVRVETVLETVPPAMANGNQIQQVLLNLLINARQAMPQGGIILIKLAYDAAVANGRAGGARPRHRHAARSVAQNLRSVLLHQSGPRRQRQRGHRLGLSTCRDIVEAHHGRIRVDSAVGRGTAFSIKLPAAIATAPVAIISAAAIPSTTNSLPTASS